MIAANWNFNITGSFILSYKGKKAVPNIDWKVFFSFTVRQLLRSGFIGLQQMTFTWLHPGALKSSLTQSFRSILASADLPHNNGWLLRGACHSGLS